MRLPVSHQLASGAGQMPASHLQAATHRTNCMSDGRSLEMDGFSTSSMRHAVNHQHWRRSPARCLRATCGQQPTTSKNQRTYVSRATMGSAAAARASQSTSWRRKLRATTQPCPHHLRCRSSHARTSCAQ
jgi:hypothetical protein